MSEFSVKKIHFFVDKSIYLCYNNYTEIKISVT